MPQELLTMTAPPGFQASVKWDEGFEELLKKPGVVLLDVRNPDELVAKPLLPGSFHVPCRMADDPRAVMEAGVARGDVPADKASAIVVFCAVGGRSGRAAAALKELGYTSVMNGGGCDEIARLRAKSPEEELESSLAASKNRIVTHMNEDHGDSLLVYARHFGRLDEATASLITDLSAKGMTLDVTLADTRKETIFVPYSRPLSSAKDIRPVVVEMHHEAYNALGFLYKLRNGYYSSVAKNPKARLSALVAAAAVTGLVFMISRRRHSEKELKA